MSLLLDICNLFFLLHSVPSFQVVNPSGEYVAATPMEGTIVVNVADMLEIWSGGRFKSTKHRVIIPDDIQQPRQSIAFFVHPDNHTQVSPVDGSSKYQSTNALEYLLRKFGETY